MKIPKNANDKSMLKEMQVMNHLTHSNYSKELMQLIKVKSQVSSPGHNNNDTTTTTTTTITNNNTISAPNSNNFDSQNKQQQQPIKPPPM